MGEPYVKENTLTVQQTKKLGASPLASGSRRTYLPTYLPAAACGRKTYLPTYLPVTVASESTHLPTYLR